MKENVTKYFQSMLMTCVFQIERCDTANVNDVINILLLVKVKALDGDLLH